MEEEDLEELVSKVCIFDDGHSKDEAGSGSDEKFVLTASSHEDQTHHKQEGASSAIAIGNNGRTLTFRFRSVLLLAMLVVADQDQMSMRFIRTNE